MQLTSSSLKAAKLREICKISLSTLLMIIQAIGYKVIITIMQTLIKIAVNFINKSLPKKIFQKRDLTFLFLKQSTFQQIIAALIDKNLSELLALRIKVEPVRSRIIPQVDTFRSLLRLRSSQVENEKQFLMNCYVLCLIAYFLSRQRSWLSKIISFATG